MGGRGTGRAHSRDTLAWLLEATNRMVRCRTVPALLDVAYDAVRDGLGYDRVGIALIDHEREGLIEQIGTDALGRKFYPRTRLLPIAPGAYHARILAASCMQPDGVGFWYRPNAADEMPPALRDHLDGRPGQNLLIALRSAEAILGLISVDNLLSGRPITPEDAPPLVALANALASALENAQLLEGHARRIGQLDGTLRRHLDQLEWLRETSRTVSAARTLEEVLDVVYDGIREGLGFDRVGIMLFDHERRIWEERRGTDEHGRRMALATRTDSFDAGSGSWTNPVMAALLGGEEFYYTADAWAAFPPEHRYLLDGQVRHNLVVPLRCGEVLTGSISVDNLPSGRPLTLDDAGPLLALAHQVATAVENARLLERERVERARLQAVLESAPIVLFGLDSRGAFTLATGGERGLMGVAPGALVGRPIAAAFARYPEVLRHYARAAAGEALTATVEVGGASMEVHWLPQRAGDGTVAGVIGVAVDVTERAGAQRAAEALARLRADFVASVSHELRTPLAAIVGYGELLQARWADLADGRKRDFLARIVGSAGRQQRLVEDLLLLTRMEQGDLRPGRDRVPLARAAKRAAEEVRGSYPGQRIDLAGPAALAATADSGRVVQILVNLLDNAAKYSPEGSPIALCWEQERGMAAVRVRDRGPGIPPSVRGQLFTRFGRLPGSRTRAGRVGTGLGLYLGRQLAVAMGGSLELEDSGPGGSTFCLCLPPAREGGVARMGDTGRN